LTEQESDSLNGLAARLRLIQADGVATTPEKRREFLHEEVARYFKDVLPANRRRFLEALLARFPVGGQVVKSTPVSAPHAPAPLPVEEPFEELQQRFLAAVKQLPEEQRLAVAKRLTQEGLAGVDRQAPVLEIPLELQQALGLPAVQQPQLKALAELCRVLVDLVQRLDERGLATIRDLSPKSPLLRRPQDFRSAAAQFLTGETGALEPQVQLLSRLLGALLAAMLGGGRDFARQYLERFSTSAIEDVVVGEGGKLFGPSKKERCWDKYVELSRDYATPELIDRRIKECLAMFAEKRGSGGR
jgi:hypothetical protein